MRMPRFDNTWTIGNALTLLALFLGGMGVYTKINNQLTQQAELIRQYGDDIQELRLEDTETENRVRQLELSQGRIDEKLISIAATLQEIKAALVERYQE
jgi:septal ring factor EnvC (AmiA/AmiB activator)